MFKYVMKVSEKFLLNLFTKSDRMIMDTAVKN